MRWRESFEIIQSSVAHYCALLERAASVPFMFGPSELDALPPQPQPSRPETVEAPRRLGWR